jgi:hypothetical protein
VSAARACFGANVAATVGHAPRCRSNVVYYSTPETPDRLPH